MLRGPWTTFQVHCSGLYPDLRLREAANTGAFQNTVETHSASTPAGLALGPRQCLAGLSSWGRCAVSLTVTTLPEGRGLAV